MLQSSSLQSISEVVKKQRLVWSWAVIMGLFLIVVAHAPKFPVIAGCMLAILFTTMRAGSKSKNP